MWRKASPKPRESVGLHADWTLLHSCTSLFVTALVCALDHSSNASALAQDCHKIELHLPLSPSMFCENRIRTSFTTCSFCEKPVCFRHDCVVTFGIVQAERCRGLLFSCAVVVMMIMMHFGQKSCDVLNPMCSALDTLHDNGFNVGAAQPRQFPQNVTAER